MKKAGKKRGKFRFANRYCSKDPSNIHLRKYASWFSTFYAITFQKFEINFSFADPPIVDLKLGNNLNAVQIKEGYDVYFECKIKSNPREQKITWLKNVSTSTFCILFKVKNHRLFLMKIRFDMNLTTISRLIFFKYSYYII